MELEVISINTVTFQKLEKSFTHNAGYRFENIMGKSESLSNAVQKAKTASRCQANTLLIGESGTGKEMFAQSMHNLMCPGGPFVAVNCGAIPPNLVESELFGFEGGSFTGSDRRGRNGKCEMAHGGTLFLDEIGDMPLHIQPVLLRVLEEKKVVRIGGEKEIPVDFRVIAATNKDLVQMVKEKQFREDLYFRLAVFKINIPSLRERKSDISMLAQYLIEKQAKKHNLSVPDVNQAALQKILSYSWPGNIREMENAMLYAVSMAHNGIIDVDSLPEHIIKGNSLEMHNINENKLLTLSEIETDAIIKTLNFTGKNISQAAKILGIAKSTLYRKIKEYEIAV